MNNRIILAAFFTVLLNTGCSGNTADVAKITTVDAAIQSSAAQTKKRMRHRLPEGVISVDIVNNNQRLHLLTGKHHHGQKSLWYQSSTDGGHQWSTAVKILDDGDLQVKMTRGSDAQITAQGNTLVVTWMQYVEGVRFNAGPMMAARSTDGGQTWKMTTAPPDWITGPHGYVDLASDNHAMHAVWLDSRNGPSELKAAQGLRYAKSTDGGQSWKVNKTLDNVTCSCCWNTVKTDTHGNAFVLYRDKKPSDLAIGIVDPQQHWQQLSKVGAFNWNFDGCPHIGGGLDIKTSGSRQELHAVVGTGHPDHLGVFYLRSEDSGHRWSEPLQLGDETALHGDVAAQNNGRIIAVWDMMGEKGLAVFFAASDNNGVNWTSPKQVSSKDMRATHPRIVKTVSGFFMLWTENDGQQQTLMTQIL